MTIFSKIDSDLELYKIDFYNENCDSVESVYFLFNGIIKKDIAKKAFNDFIADLYPYDNFKYKAFKRVTDSGICEKFKIIVCELMNYKDSCDNWDNLSLNIDSNVIEYANKIFLALFKG